MEDQFFVAEPGHGYGLAGQTSSFQLVRKIVGNSGSYTVAGSAVTLRTTRRLAASSGSLSLNGSLVGLLLNYQAQAQPAAVNLPLLGNTGILEIGGTML